MKLVTLFSLLSVLAVTTGCSSNKYEKERLDIQKEEAKDMIDKSEDIKIKKGWGNDKIILQDQ